jgi:hypothetical protein
MIDKLIAWYGWKLTAASKTTSKITSGPYRTPAERHEEPQPIKEIKPMDDNELYAKQGKTIVAGIAIAILGITAMCSFNNYHNNIISVKIAEIHEQTTQNEANRAMCESMQRTTPTK